MPTRPQARNLYLVASLAALVGGSTLTGCVADVEPLERLLGRIEAVDSLALGRVQVGDPATLDLEVSNPGPGPVHIEAFAWSSGESGPAHRFELDGVPGWLRAGESMTLGVRFVALGDSGPVEATLSLLSDTDDPDVPGAKQSHQIRVTAEGVRWGLDVRPNPVELGRVPSGTPRGAELELTNRLDRPLTVFTPDADGGRAGLFDVQGEGRFEVDAYVGPAGDVPRGRAQLEAGGTLRIPVGYVAPSVSLGAGGVATWRVGGCADEACWQEVTIAAQTDSDALFCRPEDVDFGAVYPGQERFRNVTCFNRGPVPLRITGASMEAGSADELGVETLTETTVAPGRSFELTAWFRPTEATLQRGEVSGTVRIAVLHEDSGVEGYARVRLFGLAGGARLEIVPNPLDFGEVAVRTSRTDRLTIRNVGFETAYVTQIEVDIDGTGAFTADVTPFEVARGAEVTFEVTFTPESATRVASGVRFITTDAVTPEHVVGLVGIGLDLQPCMYNVDPPEVRFGAVRIGDSANRTLTIRNVGNFDCLVRDARIEPPAGAPSTPFSMVTPGIPPTRITPGQSLSIDLRFVPVVAQDERAEFAFYISDPQNSNPRVPLVATGRSPVEVACPGPVTTSAGQPVDLEVLADGTSPIVRYDWAIISAPRGGIGTPDQWQPDPPTAARERFLPFLVGVYEIQVTVFDTVGNSASCTTQVTAEGRGLRVTLTWNGSGDVDLHLHRSTTTAWFTNDDCHYSNPRPIWDSSWPQSQGANPELDFDNTRANGPENTRVNVVQIGTTYTIAAHNYSRAQGREATIQIFCGGGTTADATFTSRPLVGTGSGNCSANDFWKVATVVFDTATTCRVTPIESYVRSSDACNTY